MFNIIFEFKNFLLNFFRVFSNNFHACYETCKQRELFL